MKRYSIILASNRFEDAYNYAAERRWDDFAWTWRPSGWDEVREYRLVEPEVVM